MRAARRLALLLLCAVAGLLVAAQAAAAATFSNSTPIAVPGSGTIGPASPYPSSVEVSGQTGPVDDVNVTLNRVGHERPFEISVLLVSPTGESVILMRQNCGTTPIEDSLWTFDQDAAAGMPQTGTCDEFLYRPNPSGDIDPPPPAPAGPHGTSLDDFNGENPNGTWSLYVHDRFEPMAGDIEGGWTLTLGSAATDTSLPGSGTSGRASRYPGTQTFAQTDELVTDVNVSLEGVWHQRPDDIELLLVGPQGQAATLMSDACGSFEAEGVDWTWDGEATSPMSDGDASNSCPSGSYRPVNHDLVETWATPAPPGPHEANLEVFDGTDPSGEWQLYAADDATGAVGFLSKRFTLDIETEPRAEEPEAFGTDTNVSLGLAKKRVSRKGPVLVRVSNGNAFPVTGVLREVEFQTAPNGESVLEVALTKSERKKLRRKGSVRAALVATVRDPAGNERTVEQAARVKLRKR